ncbi:hypothetical protein FNV43_RR23039 [Rhamnella rubrinervis]|uniref:Dolichol-phosphate mannosyltransferase subunit 3 n=1 Tax=Rhamnella rubrinervis TaxID=2594499 RepID=A0A8K0DR94_9ROSA|nr:hypothetical protein FNV43_RR23039 [Rhamnella rubrinervis]
MRIESYAGLKKYEAYHKNIDIAGVHLCLMDRAFAGICNSTQPYLVAYCGIVFICSQLPIYFIVSLGCYGLLMVGVGLMRFPTCPQEALLLQQDIVEAKGFLKQRGVDVGG